MRPLPVTTGARAACFAHGPPLGSSAAPPAQGSTRRPLLPATSASAASAAASTAVAAAAVAAAAAALPLGSSPAPSHSQQHVPQARSPRMHPVVASHCVFNRRFSVVPCAAKAAGGTETALKAGALVEYRKDGDRSVLVLLTEPNGKTNWWAVDQAGRRQSLQPKQVQLVLPGGSYTAADVTAFQSAAESADRSMLEVVWELAVDGGAPVSLLDLASLLFDSQDAKSLYITYRLLVTDLIYFKQVGKGQGLDSTFEAKPAAQVEATRKQLEAEAAARRDEEAFVAAVNVSLKAKTRAEQASAEVWTQGPHSQRIQAILAVALAKESAPLPSSTLNLACDSLQLAGALHRSAKPTSVTAQLRAAAVALLMDLRVFRYHEPLEILRSGLDPVDLPAPLQKKAQALLSQPPPDPSAANRMDLTHLSVTTIDDEGTLEVDDGLSVERLQDGGLRLWVHVADPTRWLLPGDSLDVEARKRTRTLYLPWGFVPMFPRSLAAGPFSLQGEGCDAMSVGAELARDGSIKDVQVAATRIRVTQRLTYDQADAQLEAEGGGAQAADLSALWEAACSRRQYRENQGCIEIPLPEAKIHVPLADLDSARPRVEVKRLSQWESPSRQLVAEMMILAGEAVGLIGAREGLPLPYRGQEAPVLPSDAALAAVPPGPCRAHLLRSCMTRSTVASKPQRHASLGLSAYVQFTSPIRRYVDLVAHFQIRAWLQRQPLPYSALDIENITGAVQEEGRALGQLEREQDNYWLSEFFRQRPDEPWDATMLGWFREESRLASVLIETLGWEVVTRLDASMDARPGDTLQLLLLETAAAGAGGAGAARGGGGKDGAKDGAVAPRFRVTSVLRGGAAVGAGGGGEGAGGGEGDGLEDEPDFGSPLDEEDEE